MRARSRLALPVQMKRLGKRRHRLGGFALCAARLALQTSRKRLQQLAGVVKIAAPQHRRAFAGETIGDICAEAVIRNHYTFGWKYAALGSPEGRPGLAGFDPADHRKIIHREILRWQQQFS